jgi:ATP-binding cassette, subfamily C (CFTR/MRP), member 1
VIQVEASEELEALSDSSTLAGNPQIARPTISAEGRTKKILLLSLQYSIDVLVLWLMHFLNPLSAGDSALKTLRMTGAVQDPSKFKDDTEAELKPVAALTTIEEKAEGDVKWSTYSYYIKAGGIFKFFNIMIFICLYQALTVVASYWLAYWGTVDSRGIRNGVPLSPNENVYYLNYYALYTMMGVIALTVRAITLAQHRLGTSVLLHEQLVESVFGAAVAFFDVTPQGRLLNRFSSDMVIIDEELSQSISQLTNSLFSVFGAIAAIAAATQGIFLILCVPLVFLYEKIQRYFRKSNTAIARLQSVSLSPIYTDFSQALAGLSTIRAYGVSQRFIDSLQKRVDYNTVPLIMAQLAIQWLAIRLDFIGSLISLFIAVLAIGSNGLIPASFLALGLTYSFQMTTYLKFAVRMIATAEAQMNSVERVKYYIDNIDQEEDGTQKGPDGKSVVIPDDWPLEGAVVGTGVEMRYRDGPLVLKGVDFSVQGGEKIGVAGRTGSGKSSLMIGLFRIQELASGTIFIDGIDIRTVPLRTLRSRLGIIPQDPVIFSASVRFNLDPFEIYTDSQIWSVLNSVDMKAHVSTLPDKLSEVVAEGGDNFSTGQRQLVCIARALLRKPKILVLDEATASIDNETDEMIQKMVRANFQDSTVLTIAHRLNTIVDSDRVIVMDTGIMAECGPPETLLADTEGAFRSLWDRHQKSHLGGTSRSSSKNDLASLAEEGASV